MFSGNASQVDIMLKACANGPPLASVTDARAFPVGDADRPSVGSGFDQI